jgi:hypothetical protein
MRAEAGRRRQPIVHAPQFVAPAAAARISRSAAERQSSFTPERAGDLANQESDNNLTSWLFDIPAVQTYIIQRHVAQNMATGRRGN